MSVDAPINMTHVMCLSQAGPCHCDRLPDIVTEHEHQFTILCTWVKWERWGWVCVCVLHVEVCGERDCVGAFMPPHFDSAGPAPSSRSAGV